MQTLGRILFQLVLSGPLAIFYPVLVFGIGYTVSVALSDGLDKAANGALLLAGGLGLTGLYASILLPLGWLRSRAWLRWTVTALMAVGVLLALWFGWAVASDWRRDDDPLHLWMLGGPLAVATWNLWRMHATPMQETAPMQETREAR